MPSIARQPNTNMHPPWKRSSSQANASCNARHQTSGTSSTLPCIQSPSRDWVPVQAEMRRSPIRHAPAGLLFGAMHAARLQVLCAAAGGRPHGAYPILVPWKPLVCPPTVEAMPSITCNVCWRLLSRPSMLGEIVLQPTAQATISRTWGISETRLIRLPRANDERQRPQEASKPPTAPTWLQHQLRGRTDSLPEPPSTPRVVREHRQKWKNALTPHVVSSSLWSSFCHHLIKYEQYKASSPSNLPSSCRYLPSI